jgi:hypothetical protein
VAKKKYKKEKAKKKLRSDRQKMMLGNRKSRENKYWTTRAKMIYVFISILLTLVAFRDDFIIPTYKWLFPDNFYRDGLDDNIRGTFLKATSSIDRDSLEFIIGSSLTRKIGFRYNAVNLFQSRKNGQTYSCFWPNNFFIVKGHEKYCPINYRFSNDGRILFSAELLNLENEDVLYMSDNQFILNDNNLYTFNGDDYGLELIDKSGRVLFSADFVPPNQIWLQGVFYNQNGTLGFVNRALTPIQPGNTEKLKVAKDSINRIFFYTGKDWQGKRVPIVL